MVALFIDLRDGDTENTAHVECKNKWYQTEPSKNHTEYTRATYWESTSSRSYR